MPDRKYFAFLWLLSLLLTCGGAWAADEIKVGLLYPTSGIHEIADTGRFLAALTAVQYDAPSGRFRFDAHQNAVVNLYVRKVQPGPGGQLVNIPIDMLPEIEQYSPKGKPAMK